MSGGLTPERCDDLLALTHLTRADVLRLELPVGQCRLLMLGLANMGNRHAADSGMRPDRTVPAQEAEGSDRPDSGPEEQDDEDNELDIARVWKQALQLCRAGEKLDGLSERESEGEESLAGVRGMLSRQTTCPPRKQIIKRPADASDR